MTRSIIGLAARLEEWVSSGHSTLSDDLREDLVLAADELQKPLLARGDPLWGWLEANSKQYGFQGGFARGTGGVDAAYIIGRLAAALDAPRPPLSNSQIKHMVDRFLQWRLPDPWHPDGGVSFEPEFNAEYNAQEGRPPSRHEPIGTNLFDATQATAMVKAMLDGMVVDRQEVPYVIQRVVNALADKAETVKPRRYRHLRRGSEYVLVGIARFQSAKWMTKAEMTPQGMARYPADNQEVVVYQSVEDGSLGARPRGEFEDGRFEEIVGS